MSRIGRRNKRWIATATIIGAACVPLTITAVGNAATTNVRYRAAASSSHPSQLLGRASALAERLLVASGKTPSGRGAIYLFALPTSGHHDLTQVAVLRLKGEPAGDGFGSAVATDGSTIIVGAPETVVGGHANAGAAYVYAKPRHGWKSTSRPTATLTDADPADGEFFGNQVGVSGRTALAGAIDRAVDTAADAGSGLVFVEPKQGWVTGHQTAVLTSSTAAAADQTGVSAAISGRIVVLGSRAGNALVFAKPASGWADATETRRLGPASPSGTFGQGVAIDGTTVAVGDPGYTGDETSQGAVTVFQRPSGGWAAATSTLTSNALLTATDGASNDAIGSVLAVSGDTVVAGSPSHDVDTAQEQGVAYVWRNTHPTWQASSHPRELVATDGRKFDEFGSSVAAAYRTVAVGSPFADNPNDTTGDAGGVEYVFAKQPRKK